MIHLRWQTSSLTYVAGVVWNCLKNWGQPEAIFISLVGLLKEELSTVG